jgi:hypothetical protein
MMSVNIGYGLPPIMYEFFNARFVIQIERGLNNSNNVELQVKTSCVNVPCRGYGTLCSIYRQKNHIIISVARIDSTC